MTKLPQPEQWIFTREIQLESGEQQIDGYDAEGFPIRLCKRQTPPPGMHLFSDANGPEGDDE